MLESIVRNDVNDYRNDEMLLSSPKSFTSKKCLFCSEDVKRYLCLCKDCGFYFCNNLLGKKSHIYLHLKGCKHKNISLIPFETYVQCELCKEKNVFNLKFAKHNGKFRYLCEECSKNEKNYSRIVVNKKINNEILPRQKLPPLANREDNYTESLIIELNRKIILLLKVKNLPFVTMSYSTKENYCNSYYQLICSEIQAINEENQENPSFQYFLQFLNDNYVEILINPYSKEKMQFHKRQILLVLKKDELQEEEQIICIGKVYDIVKNKVLMFCIYLKNGLLDGLYYIKEKETTESYKSMLAGVEDFEPKKSNKMDINIEKIIIGYTDELSNKNDYIRFLDIPKDLDIPEFRDKNIYLNNSQKNAILVALQHKLSIIRGPPGTGKTTVLVTIVYQLNNLKKKNHKILVCAPSNQAVINIILLLSQIKYLKFVQVLSREKEISEEINKKYSLYTLVKEAIYKDQKKNQRIITLLERRERLGVLDDKDFEEYKKLMSIHEERILDSCDIVLSTVNNAADTRLKDYYFSIVIIDEAAQALEPDCLLPIYHHAEMAILIGDEKQLGPIVISPDAEASGFGISLFERLFNYYKGSDFIAILTEQFRMHEFLYRFPNDKFYQNQMITRTRYNLDEKVMKEFPFPNKKCPSLLYHYTGKEENELTSYFNKTEINICYQIAKKLINCGVEPEKIGIITPYNAQKYKLWEKFYENKKFEKIKIESVDGYQGMEKDYIIYCTTRSNDYGLLGFIKAPKRLNVGLTRARKGLIILGNCQCLAKRPGILRDLVLFYSSQNLIVKGELENLELVEKREIIAKPILDEEDVDENNEYRNEIKFYQGVKIKSKKKNEKSEKNNGHPAPLININENNKINDNKKENDNKINENKKGNDKNNNMINDNNKNNNKNEKKDNKAKNNENKIKKDVEKNEPKKHKKKKKKEEKEEEEEKEEKDKKKDKKGNKRWKIKNIYNKKNKKANEKEEDKKEDIKEEDAKEEPKEKKRKNKKRGNIQEEDKKEKQNNKNKKEEQKEKKVKKGNKKKD